MKDNEDKDESYLVRIVLESDPVKRKKAFDKIVYDLMEKNYIGDFEDEDSQIDKIVKEIYHIIKEMRDGKRPKKEAVLDKSPYADQWPYGYDPKDPYKKPDEKED